MAVTAVKVSSGYPVPGTTLQEQYDSAGECPEKNQQEWWEGWNHDLQWKKWNKLELLTLNNRKLRREMVIDMKEMKGHWKEDIIYFL